MVLIRKVMQEMNKEKGILGRILSVAGAILVVVGVFVFQGVSNADDSTTPADTGGVELATGSGNTGETGGEQNTGAGGESNAETGGSAATVPEGPTTYNYAIKYYTVTETTDESTGETQTVENLFDTDSYDGVETEHTFVVKDSKPTSSEGDFVAWKDADTGEYYTASDEIALTADKSEKKLIAYFAVLKSYALIYDANGGKGAPAAQSCESYLPTCDFVISKITPSRDGYEFKGWQKDGDDTITYAPESSIRSHSSEEPLKVKAVWAEIRTYTLIYEANGGNGAPEALTCKSANGGCSFVVSDVMPTRKDFEFIDWQNGTESVGPGATINVTELTTILVANWNPVTVFTMEYVAEDASNIPEPQKCQTTVGTCTFIVPSTEPTKDGYKFLGWRFEDKEDMLAKVGDEIIVGIDGSLNLKIKAVWSRMYSVLNSGEVFGAGERVILRSVAEQGNFKSLVIDSEEVPSEYFSIGNSGPTSVVLSNAFAQALSVGEHAFTITWSDGEASGIISVNQNEDGSKRFVIVDIMGNTTASGLMYRPKAGAISKESSAAATDSATDNKESNMDAIRTLILVAVGVFIVAYIANRFYVRHKMDFIENF